MGEGETIGGLPSPFPSFSMVGYDEKEKEKTVICVPMAVGSCLQSSEYPARSRPFHKLVIIRMHSAKKALLIS